MNLPHLSTLPDWREFPRVALDIETRDPNLKKLGPGVRRAREEGGFIAGVSFACDDGTAHGPAFYLPLRHEGGGNYANPEAALQYLRHQSRSFRGSIVGANLQYDLDWLAEAGVEFQPDYFRDVQISAPLLEEPRAYGAPLSMALDAIARRLGLEGKDEGKLEAYAHERGWDPKADMWRMPAGVVHDYAVQDVRLPLKIIKRHERTIDEEELWTVYNLECRLLPVLLSMRRTGVAVDLERVERIEQMAMAKEEAEMREVARLSGRKVTAKDTMRAAALAPCLEADGVMVPETPTGKPSVKADWLSSLSTPIAGAIKRARKWNKVRTTFCESVRTHQVRGRIHCTFNQLRQMQESGETKGAAFGRLSCSNPNLQQQPARDPEIGPMWRAIYRPDDGGQWACLDFSSQEPRLIAHYAEAVAAQPGCRWPDHIREAAVASATACREDPHWDNHSMMAGMMYDEFDVRHFRDFENSEDEAEQKLFKRAKGLRGDAKTIFLGLCYGMGSAKLARSLGLPTEWQYFDWANDGRGGKVEVAGPEGQALLARFHERVPYIKALTKAAQLKAQRAGYIKTLLGRRCRFPRKKNGEIEWSHKALNRLVQGSAADQTKLAMVLAHEAGIRLQLQVHDELDLTVWSLDEARALNEIMVHAVELRVPTRCDIEVGPDWGNVKGIAA